MAQPRTRQEFKEYCLRALGAPVIDINVDDQQVEDRIDQALQFFNDWHGNGSQRVYYKYQVTEQDKTNGYLDTNLIDSKLQTVNRVFSIGFNLQMNNIFNVRYQMALTDFYGLRTGQMNMNYFVSTMQYLEMLQQLLDPEKQVRFNKHVNRLYVDMNWQDFVTGQYLLIEGYTDVNPEDHSDAWGEPVLKKYATALIKRQWAANLSKYSGIPLPGNVTFNGERLYQEASEEITKLEEEILTKYQSPPEFLTG